MKIGELLHHCEKIISDYLLDGYIGCKYMAYIRNVLKEIDMYKKSLKDFYDIIRVLLREKPEYEEWLNKNYAELMESYYEETADN